METHNHTCQTRILSQQPLQTGSAGGIGNTGAASVFPAAPKDALSRFGIPAGDPFSEGMLRVNLLGGLEVLVDGEPYDHPFLHRQKVKALLAALVLSEGRELNTEYLQTLLWPNSSAEKNRNNFNNLWSLLRKALMVRQDGACPYVVRHQGVCKLDRRYVDSDVFELHAICDAFQFGDPSVSDAVALYRHLQKIYRGDMLPGEDANRLVIHDRRVWRNRTVDALHSMALSLQAQAALREADWFAQAALALDPAREDVLRLLMRLNLDRGNPSRALVHFAGTSRILGEQYGLDPHPETLELAREAMGERAAQQETGRAHPPKDPCATGRVRPRPNTQRHPAQTGAALPSPAAVFRSATGALPNRESR